MSETPTDSFSAFAPSTDPLSIAASASVSGTSTSTSTSTVMSAVSYASTSTSTSKLSTPTPTPTLTTVKTDNDDGTVAPRPETPTTSTPTSKTAFHPSTSTPGVNNNTRGNKGGNTSASGSKSATPAPATAPTPSSASKSTSPTPATNVGGGGAGGTTAELTLKDFLPFDIMDSDMFSVAPTSSLSPQQITSAGITQDEISWVHTQLKRQGIHDFMLTHAAYPIYYLRRVIACFGVNPDALKIQPSDFSAHLYKPESIESLYPELLAEPTTENQIKSRLLTALSCAATKELRRRERLKKFHSIDHVLDLLKSSKRIIILSGAGVSTSCGIPDFRSENGLYVKLQERFPDLQDPQDMFHMQVFREDPSIFFSFAREIYPSKFEPSPSHQFVKLLQDHKKLLRSYTQNIDGLFSKCGIDPTKSIECHGSFKTASCISCRTKVPGTEIEAALLRQEMEYCKICRGKLESSVEKKRAKGVPKSWGKGKRAFDDDYDDNVIDMEGELKRIVVKPDITFFGEKVANTYDKVLLADHKKVDLIIIMGTSLQVAPVSQLVWHLPHDVPQILINKEPLPPNRITPDIALYGDSDTIVSYLCHRLRWTLPPSPHSKSYEELRRVSMDIRQRDKHEWVFEGAKMGKEWEQGIKEEAKNYSPNWFLEDDGSELSSVDEEESKEEQKNTVVVNGAMSMMGNEPVREWDGLQPFVGPPSFGVGNRTNSFFHRPHAVNVTFPPPPQSGSFVRAAANREREWREEALLSTPQSHGQGFSQGYVEADRTPSTSTRMIQVPHTVAYENPHAHMQAQAQAQVHMQAQGHPMYMIPILPGTAFPATPLGQRTPMGQQPYTEPPKRKRKAYVKRPVEGRLRAPKACEDCRRLHARCQFTVNDSVCARCDNLGLPCSFKYDKPPLPSEPAQIKNPMNVKTVETREGSNQPGNSTGSIVIQERRDNSVEIPELGGLKRRLSITGQEEQEQNIRRKTE